MNILNCVFRTEWCFEVDNGDVQEVYSCHQEQYLPDISLSQKFQNTYKPNTELIKKLRQLGEQPPTFTILPFQSHSLPDSADA